MIGKVWRIWPFAFVFGRRFGGCLSGKLELLLGGVPTLAAFKANLSVLFKLTTSLKAVRNRAVGGRWLDFLGLSWPSRGESYLLSWLTPFGRVPLRNKPLVGRTPEIFAVIAFVGGSAVWGRIVSVW
ncbi:hypothetical protein ACJJTC_001829 [Scirpophaga incertulas]